MSKLLSRLFYNLADESGLTPLINEIRSLKDSNPERQKLAAIEAIKRYLQNEADPNLTGRSGTPLHYLVSALESDCCGKHALEAIKLLRQYGAELSVADNL